MGVPESIRPATFRDAQAIDAFVAGFAPLRRDLDAWVNQAEYHVALVDDSGVVGFGARSRHKSHPDSDLVTVWVAARPNRAECEDALFNALRFRTKRQQKARADATDADALAALTRNGFVERIRSATYTVRARDLAGTSAAIAVDDRGRALTDALRDLYASSHRWDPPAHFTHRHIRQSMILGAEHIAITLDDAGAITGVGIAHRSDDPAAAADVALVGPVDQAHPDADAITRDLLAHLAACYVEEREPLWFEIDTGPGTNEALARAITPLASPTEEVVIFTTASM